LAKRRFIRFPLGGKPLKKGLFCRAWPSAWALGGSKPMEAQYLVCAVGVKPQDIAF